MSFRCVLFDFFGTLVSYSDSRTEQGYRLSHALVRDLGADLGYEEFLGLWVEVSEEVDAAADRDDSEFSMVELAETFLARATGRRPAPDDSARFAQVYIAEWNQGVRYFPGISDFLDRVGKERRLGIVTNTHDGGLIRTHLDAMGIRGRFETIVTSLELRCRKPRAEIFNTALDRIGATSAETLFVGDSLAADYRGAEAVGMTPVLVDPERKHAADATLWRVHHLFDVEGALDR